ncbi:MAG: cytidine deaminase [Pseudomonadota bacterium]
MKTAPDTLIAAAEEARRNAHAPYSKYTVGVALTDDRGHVHVGCNVENAAYPAGNCAETSAIASMVVDGGRRIVDIVVIGGHAAPGACTPCGGCRQRIGEFANHTTTVWCRTQDSADLQPFTMDQLLPAAFDLKR